MVLLLVTHTIEVPSSRVPLSAIILVDAIKRKQLPANLKCRLVIPSAGHHSCSVWDASSVEELQAWIDTNLLDGTASIAEIPEEFTYGLSLELTTARAADKVATTSKTTLERINTTGARVMESMSEKVRVKLEQLDARTNLITATRETASAAAAKVKQATSSAMESERVQRGLASLSTSLQSAGTSMNRAFTWVGSKVKESFGAEAGAGFGGAGGAQSYSGFSSEPPSYEAAAYASAPAAAAGLAGAGAGFMPVSTHAARPSSDQHHTYPPQSQHVAGPGPVTEDAGPAPQFTLDEGVASPMLSPTKEAADTDTGGGGKDDDGEGAGGLDTAPMVAPVGAAAT